MPHTVGIFVFDAIEALDFAGPYEVFTTASRMQARATPLGGLARNLYAAHSLAGHGALDFSSVIKLVQKAG